jgi:hypothetical protein
VIDLVASQRVLADLVLDDELRREWESDPTAFASARLAPREAAMIAGLDPRGLEAMSRSHEAKKARFDFLHARHHAYEDAKAEQAGVHSHDHDHGPDGHTHDHDHDHGHDHGPDGHTHDHDHEAAS